MGTHPYSCPSTTEVALAAKPDAILGWFRKLVARKYDGSKPLLLQPLLIQRRTAPLYIFEHPRNGRAAPRGGM